MNTQDNISQYEALEQVLNNLKVKSINLKDRGEKFERLCKTILENAPVFKTQVKKVWMYKDFPGKFHTDDGIDLVVLKRDGTYVAAQCKFYDREHTVTKSDIDKLISASQRLISKVMDPRERERERATVKYLEQWFFCTSDKKSKHATDFPNLKWFGFDFLAGITDWTKYDSKNNLLKPSSLKDIREYQKEAVDKVISGFKSNDRGKLIMPCGTGKTFTSLKISEEFIRCNKKATKILYLVPSIALVSQTIYEWMLNYSLKLEKIDMFAVCSDTTATRSAQEFKINSESAQEQMSSIPISATTDPNRLIEQLNLNRTTILFSTYHSISVIKYIQDKLNFDFDLIICDEAHRTVGFEDDEVSEFKKVHDNNFIRSKKRLYMTATPKQYRDIETVKSKLSEKFNDGCYRVYSMNDKSIYGPSFYEMSFSDAISKGLLTDYKLVVLKYRRSLYANEVDKSGLQLTNGARIIGSLSALSKYTSDDKDDTFKSDKKPMKRAIAFFNRIYDAEEAEKAYKNLYRKYSKNNPINLLEPEVQTISSKDNTRSKNEKINWLKGNVKKGTCKILTNPKSLTEGVDIPNLDAVIFMQKKSSKVDIVQAVGRIMRKSEDKKFGYIIIPVDVEVDLSSSEEFKTVYNVIQALRSHDERIDQKNAQAELANKIPSYLCTIDDPNFNLKKKSWENQKSYLDRDEIDQESLENITKTWNNNDAWNMQMAAHLMKKLGNRVYWDNWSEKIGQITHDISTLIKTKLEKNNQKLNNEYIKFKNGLKNLINPNFDNDDECRTILAQHVATLPVLRTLFNSGDDFLSKNAFVSLLNNMVAQLHGIHNEVKGLNKFYESVDKHLDEIKNDDFARQNLIKRIYDNFFKYAVPKQAKKYGIVYTPIEAIDFIINSTSYLLKTKLNMELKNEKVKILEPFAGTGTFISRMLWKLREEGATDKELARKYKLDIIFHEISLTAYYTSLVNIEYTYYRLNNEYISFKNGLWIDTFFLAEKWYTKETITLPNINFAEITEKAKEINESDISVIIGNPPYFAKAKSSDNNTTNIKYKIIDERIKKKYILPFSNLAKRNVSSLFNAYVKAIRFASDRIPNKGIISFILDSGFLQSLSFSGFRSSLLKEFNSVFIYDLLGHIRNNNYDRAHQGGNIFGNRCQSGIAILFCVKNGSNNYDSFIHYSDIGGNLKTVDKLHKLKEYKSISNISFDKIYPDKNNDWFNKRNESSNQRILIGDKKFQNFSIFEKKYSRGILTGSDGYLYNFSEKELKKNIKKYIDSYNEDRINFHNQSNEKTIVQDFVKKNNKNIQWHDSLYKKCLNNVEITFKDTDSLLILYRPFVKKYIFWNVDIIREIGKWKNLIQHQQKNNFNKFIVCSNGGNKNPSYLASGNLTDIQCVSNSQCFPLYWLENNNANIKIKAKGMFDDDITTKIEAINPEVVTKFQSVYKDDKISANDIFNYIYGILNSKTYVNKYHNDLSKSLPEITFLDNFWKYAETGKQLIDLHINYENKEPYNRVRIKTKKDDYTVKKIKFGNNKDKSVIIYNDYITIENIPLEAYDYKVNGKSPLEWVVSEYKYEDDKHTGIVNNPNDFDPVKKGKYIFDLILSLITVSLKTRDLINGLPEYKELDVEI